VTTRAYRIRVRGCKSVRRCVHTHNDGTHTDLAGSSLAGRVSHVVLGRPFFAGDGAVLRQSSFAPLLASLSYRSPGFRPTTVNKNSLVNTPGEFLCCIQTKIDWKKRLKLIIMIML